MWRRSLITIFIFFVLAILQTSFSSQFSLAGARLNLVFILFFTLIFFEKQNEYLKTIILAISAGILLDIFSVFYFGSSVAALLAVLFFDKKILHLLRDLPERYPISYFAPLFCLSFFVYKLFLEICHCLFNSFCTFDLLRTYFLIEITYNLLLAVVIFYIYRKLFIKIPGHEFRQIQN